MRKLFLLLIALGQVSLLFAQNVTNAGLKDKSRQLVSSEYDRNSLTVINLGFPGKYSDQLNSVVGSLKIPEKYFDNTINPAVVPPGVSRETAAKANDVNKMLNTSFVTNALVKARIGQKLVGKWFGRNENGYFNVNLLKERGLYNATDNQVIIAEAGKRGTASLMDMGMGLVDKSFVLVLDFPELITMEEIYNRDTVPADKRILNGFSGKMNAYLYKLNFSEDQAAVFFQDMWITEKSQDIQKRKAQFEQYNFPFTYLNSFSEDIMATQFNPGQKLAPKVQKTQAEMLKMLVETGIQQSLLKIERTNESFRVKAMIYKTNPIAVKIGRKEGLKFDQRYFVYENRQNKKGETYSVRRGVIKSMSVSDNLKVSTGESDPSLFYQVAGRKVDNMGMFIEQKNATGLNLSLGVATGYTEENSLGFTGRLDLCVSPLLYEAFVRKGKSWFLKSLKIYADGGYIKENYLDDFNFLKYSFGLSKELFLGRNAFLEPYFGYGFEDATKAVDTSYKVSSQFIEGGARLGINITPSTQFLLGAGSFAVVKFEETTGTDEEPTYFSYNSRFPDRGGPSVTIGLRFTF
jgi:hypothetical protein